MAGIYAALHVSNSYKNPIYIHSSDKVRLAYNPEKMEDYSNYYDLMIASGLKVIVYAGEWDMRSGPGNMDFLKNLRNVNPSFWNNARQTYYLPSGNEDYLTVGGYYRTDPATKFTFLTLPKAGHLAAGD